VVLVAERGNVAVENGAPVTPPAPTAVAPTAPPPPVAPARPPPVAAAAAAAPSPRAKRASEPSGGAHPASFSATFGRRENDIRRCFVDHPDATGTTEISLRFSVEQDGHVGALAVLPASVAGSSLGACLAAVGKSTVFSKQAAPLTFRIPLTVQRETAGKSGP
jgi:hypothetical protein